MYNWTELFARLGLKKKYGMHRYEVDAALARALEELALREQRPVGEIVAEVVSSGLERRSHEDDNHLCWQSLTPREQDITAFACLGYTNRQIANRLDIGDETVKTHLTHAMEKFRVHGRAELHNRLSQWDFSTWEQQG
jgi:DNA-binding NarL/FixJ family response regulator